MPYIQQIDEVVWDKFDRRTMLGEECAMGMLFYYALRLHSCLQTFRSEEAVAKFNNIDELVEKQWQCWEASDSRGQMVEMYARWPMRIVLGESFLLAISTFVSF